MPLLDEAKQREGNVLRDVRTRSRLREQSHGSLLCNNNNVHSMCRSSDLVGRAPCPRTGRRSPLARGTDTARGTVCFKHYSAVTSSETRSPTCNNRGLAMTLHGQSIVPGDIVSRPHRRPDSLCEGPHNHTADIPNIKSSQPDALISIRVPLIQLASEFLNGRPNLTISNILGGHRVNLLSAVAIDRMGPCPATWMSLLLVLNMC